MRTIALILWILVFVVAGVWLIFGIQRPAFVETDIQSGQIRFHLRASAENPLASIFVDLDRGAVEQFDPVNPAFDVEAEVVAIISDEVPEDI